MRQGERGFSYIGLLLLIAIIGAGLAVVGEVWHTEAKREKELELLFIGGQFKQAIDSYVHSSPGDANQYPARLEDLLLDNRFPLARHHLRKIYADPFTGTTDWGLVKQRGRITGVYSRSADKPLKRKGFPAEYDSFTDAGSYKDWVFGYSLANNPPVGSALTPGGVVPSPPVDRVSDPVLPPLTPAATGSGETTPSPTVFPKPG